MLDKFARMISICFEPFTISFVALFVVVSNLNLNLESKILWFLAEAFLSGLPPLLILIYEKKTGKITSWFIRNRLERRDVQIAWFVGSALFLILALFLQAPRLLLALSATMFLLSLVITVVTNYWKISVHMVGVSLFVLILLLVYSANFLWLALLIPLVGWARIKLGAHTLTQVTVGSFVTVLITYLVFNHFGLATF